MDCTTLLFFATNFPPFLGVELFEVGEDAWESSPGLTIFIPFDAGGEVERTLYKGVDNLLDDGVDDFLGDGADPTTCIGDGESSASSDKA